MSIYADLSNIDYDVTNIDTSVTSDYTTSIDPKKIIKDPRFLKDLRDHYDAKGQFIIDDEALINQFYEDGSWRDLNTIGAVGGALEAYSSGKEDRERMKRIESVWRQLPMFWQDGGRGAASAVPDIAKAIIADPLNLIPGVAAYKAGATAGRAAYVAGKSMPVLRGAASGTGKAALSEAGISAGQEAIVNTATQLRDKQLGLRDDFSLGEVGTASAIGGVFGAGVGGTIGLPSGIAGASRGIDDADSLMARGLTRADLQNELATRGARGLDTLVNNTRNVDQFSQPAPEADVEAPVEDVVDPQVQLQSVLDAQKSVAVKNLEDAMLSGADPEEIAKLESVVNDLGELADGLARIENARAQIEALQTGLPEDIKKAAKIREQQTRYEARVRVLVANIDEGGGAAQLSKDMDAEGFGTTPAPKTEEATAPDAAPPEEAAATGDGTAPVTSEAAGDVPPSPPSPEETAAARETADAIPEATDAEAPAAAEPEAAPEPPKINEAMRGKALSSGIDWRNIAPSEKSESGRITKGAVSKAIKDRAEDAEMEPYAAQVESEVLDILNRMPPNLTLSEQLEVISVSAIDPRFGYKSDPEDIVAVFKHEMGGQKAFDAPDASPNADSAVRAELDSIDIRAENGPELTDAEIDAQFAEIRKNPETHAAMLDEELQVLTPNIKGVLGDEQADLIIASIRAEPDLAKRETLLDELTDIIDDADPLSPRLTEMKAGEFTITELKRIQRISKSHQAKGLSKEVSDSLAEMKVKSQRGADTTAPAARQSQAAIDRASIMETAGRSNSGKIQAFLKRSGKGGLDPQYQVSKRGLAKEEALIRAEANGGESIIPYVTKTQEVVKSPNGDITVPKGTTVFVDGRTERSYATREYAEYVRGDRKSSNPTASEQTPDADSIKAALSSKDRDALATALLAFQRRMDQAAAKADSPNADVETAPAPAPSRGGKKLIVQSKSDPSKVRMISQRQINDGKDITAIIGQKVGEPDADPANWNVKYAPMNAEARGAALQRLFESLPEETAPTGAGARLEVGDATGEGMPLTAKEFAGVKFTATPEEAETIQRLLRTRGLSDRRLEASGINDGPDFTGGELRLALLEAEGSSWPRNLGDIEQRIQDLKDGYRIQQRIAPQGYIEDVATRAQSVEALGKIFDGHPADEIARIKKVMERLGGDRSVGPVISKGSGEGTLGALNALSRSRSTNPDTLGETSLILTSTRGSSYFPAQSVVTHELGHWAYLNILTPQDRIDFWESMQKYYGDTRLLDRSAIAERLPVGGRMDTGQVDADGNQIMATLNDMDSPQEFFANQFDMWVAQNTNLMVKDDKLWGKVARYVKAIFDRYYDKKRIDPDLEPLFAKILPPEEEKVFGLGVSGRARTPTGKAMQSNIVQLQLSRAEIEDAIQRDSADGIISAVEAYRTLLLSQAKNNAEAKTGPLFALRNTKKGKAVHKILKNRIRDIDEIMYGKMGFEEGGDDAFNPAVYENMTLRADPQEVADLLTDFYYNGYNGKFEPALGYPPDVKDMSRSTLQNSISSAEKLYTSVFQKAENTSNLASGRVPNSVKDGYEPPRDAEGNAQQSPTKRKAIAAIGKRNERTDAQATADAKTSKGKRARANASGRPTVDISTAPEVKSQSIFNLRKLYQVHKGTDYGDQIALEITAKIKAKPLPAKPVPVTREVMELGRKEINTRLLDAIHNGDSKATKMLAYEIQRRIAKRQAKKDGTPIIKPVFQQIRMSISREKVDSTGVTSSDGIPASARPSIRTTLSSITHREPEVQTASRTISYRLFNLMNRTNRGTLEDGNQLLASEMANLAGNDPLLGGSVFVNTNSQDFKDFRQAIRAIASPITRGEGNPEQRMIDLISMIGRSSALPDAERNAAVSFFRQLNPEAQDMVRNRYPQTKGLEDSVNEEYTAISLISELASEHMQGKGLTMDAIESRLSGDISAAQLTDLQRSIDRLTEYTAYVLNGNIGRTDIKEKYYLLDFYGDMMEESRGPMAGSLEGTYLSHTSHAADYAHDTLSAMPKARRSRVDKFTEGGIGYDVVNETPVVWYHGTPNGTKLRKASNPDVVFKPSQDGQYGPGYYLTANPNVASSVYAQKGTPDSMARQIDDLSLSADEKMFLTMDAAELHATRVLISRLRRDYTNQTLISGRETAETQIIQDDLFQALDLERDLAKTIEDAGVTLDPYVMPMFISLKNPANFKHSASYTLDHPFIEAVMDKMAENPDLGFEPYRFLEEEFAANGGTLDGETTYRVLTQALEDASGNPRTNLNGILKDTGHDGLITVHRNTLDNSRLNESFKDDIGANEVLHETAVLFDPEQGKHIDASEFNASDARLYQSQAGFESVPRGTLGSLVDAVLTNRIEKIDDVPVGQLGEVMEQGGSNGTLTGAVMSMVKGRNLTAGEEQAVRKRSYFTYLQSQSERMKSMGANYLGNWYKSHFPDLNQRFASKFMPIMNALNALPDADGMLRGHFRAVTAGVGQQQPASHRRIIKALRRGDGSRQEKALSTEERNIYDQIKTTFENERTELTNLGFNVGRRENYVPQVWDAKKIQKRRDEFVEKMANYYKADRARNGLTFDDAEADAFAKGIMLKLTEEGDDGVFIPARGSTKNPTFENVDYSRVIELDKYPDMLDELEDFLESDMSAILVKYLEGSSRRNVHAKKLGVNSHAVNDYLLVASDGEAGIARLLSTNKVFKTDRNAMNEDGKMEVFTLADTIRMPFTGNDAAARSFSQNLVSVHNTNGSAAARKMLNDLYPAGNPPVTYQRRVDAIIGALEDFKGEPNSMNTQDEVFIEQAMKVAMKKPMDGQGAKSVVNVSRALRMTNNVTLLGFTTLTSLGDVVLPIIRSGQFGSWAKGLSKVATDREYRTMLKNVGVAMENVVHERMIHMYGSPDNKASHAFFNATLLTPWTDMNRTIAGATGFESFIAMQKKAFNHHQAGLPYSKQSSSYKTAHRFLSRYGLQEFLPEGKLAGESLGDKSVADKFMKDEKGTDPSVRMAIIKFADESIFQPNPNDIPLWAQTPIGALVFQLKSFPLMMTRLTGHVLSEANHGNFKPLIYLSTLGPAFGMGTLAAKDIIQQRGGEDGESAALRKRNIAKTLGHNEKTHGNVDDFLGWYVESMLVMGGLGLMGDVIHSAVSQVDNGAYGQQRMWGTLLGPTFGLGNAGMQVVAGAMDESDNSNAKERSAMREIATRVPILGGNRKIRESIVEATAGEPDKGGTGGWTSSWGQGDWK